MDYQEIHHNITNTLKEHVIVGKALKSLLLPFTDHWKMIANVCYDVTNQNDNKLCKLLCTSSASTYSKPELALIWPTRDW